MKPPSPTHERIIQTGEADGKSTRRLYRPAVTGILLLAGGLKVGLLLAGAFPFNADEAIVGLMARHILQGAWPTFFYGQAYMGSLDASLVAGAFALLGPRVDAIRLVQLALYLGTVLTTIEIGRRIFGPTAGLLAGLLMAVPTVNITLYTTISLGGYGEALLIGNLLLIAALNLADHPDRGRTYLGWGLLAGLGLWAFGLTLVYVLPSALVICANALTRRVRSGRKEVMTRIGLAASGILAGASPWIIYAARNGTGPMLSELGGSAIAGASPAGLLASIGSHAFNLVVFGTTVITGLRPPWDVVWLMPALIPVVAAFWLGTVAYALASVRHPGPGHAGVLLLAGVAVSVCGGFIFTPFGADPSGRYFAPLAVPMAVFGAGLLRSAARSVGWIPVSALAVCLVAFNLAGTVASSRAPLGLTTQFNPGTRIDHAYDLALIDFLTRRGELRGYTNYWVAYPLAFLSSERAIFVPRLPYHADLRYTPRDNRYAPYDRIVAQSARTAYITTGPESLDTALREYFSDMGVTYEEAHIGDYHVYFALSKRVPPPEAADLSEALR